MDQAITIRTIVFQGDSYSFQAGAGIVKDSDPRSEYAEVFADCGFKESSKDNRKDYDETNIESC